MHIVLYHEISPKSKDQVVTEGIKKGASGVKTDSEKRKVDEFLDTHPPDWAKNIGLCRADAIYAYLKTDSDEVVDIKSGEAIPVSEFMNKTKDVLLKITVDSDYCYVSDLDLYDTITRALELDEQDSTREHLADRYWERLTPIDEYQNGSITRPEMMVNYDVSPESIEVVKS